MSPLGQSIKVLLQQGCVFTSVNNPISVSSAAAYRVWHLMRQIEGDHLYITGDPGQNPEVRQIIHWQTHWWCYSALLVGSGLSKNLLSKADQTNKFHIYRSLLWKKSWYPIQKCILAIKKGNWTTERCDITVRPRMLPDCTQLTLASIPIIKTHGSEVSYIPHTPINIRTVTNVCM